MNTYQGSVGRPAPPVAGGPAAGPLKRPATLAAATWLALATGVLGLIGGILMITGGRASVEKFAQQTAQDVLGSDSSSDIVNGLMSAAVDAAYHTLVVKAVVGIVAAALVLLFGFLARNGSTGLRVALTIFLVLAMAAGSGLQLADREALPSGSVVVAAVVPLLCIVTIVLLFLPATSRYARSRKGS
jgi:hypothetical protein